MNPDLPMTRIDEIKARLEAAAARLRVEGIQSLDPQAAADINFLLTEVERLSSDKERLDWLEHELTNGSGMVVFNVWRGKSLRSDLDEKRADKAKERA